ncbi:hypothetical protein GCM10009111_34760 [Colwellia asteriadis]|uniref:Bacteriocin n=1 Tax=Colwellia asteriadis TaxID=517723 RepID=A0ABN1LBG3_9GAMM
MKAKSEIRELNNHELDLIQGGRSSWESIGYGVGRAFGWYYNNVLIGTPWP